MPSIGKKKKLFWPLNFIRSLFSFLYLKKNSFFVFKLLKMFYFLSLNFTKKLFFVPKLLKKVLFSSLFLSLNY